MGVWAIVRIVLMALMLAASAFIIVVVTKQKGDSEGVTAIQGGSSGETFYGKNKARNTEAQLRKLTYISAAVLMFCCIAFFGFLRILIN